MELIDRYLYAVGRYLPADRRDDILAELRANILASVEDRQEELGRALTQDEVESILKQHGHPMVVAARYWPQQYLIGPTVFPYYWHVMKIAFPWVTLLYLVSHALVFISRPVTVQALVEIMVGYIPALFYAGAWITLAFALLEYVSTRYIKNKNVLYAWNPRSLPKVEATRAPEKRSNPVFDLTGSIVALMFLIVIRQHPLWILGPGVFYKNMLHPAPVWQTVFQIAIVFVSIQIVVKSVALFSPKARTWRLAADLITKASAIGIIGFLLRAKEYVVAGPAADAEMAKVADALNQAMSIGWKVVMVILCLQLAWEVGKLLFPRWHIHAKPSHFLS